MKQLMIAVALVVALTGCTDNNRARVWGGTASVKKPEATWQLIGITWKQSSMWVLWFDPKANRCHFREDSPFGMMEGQVVIEKCDPVNVKM